MRNYAQDTSNRTHDYEYRPTYGQTSCSYAMKDQRPKEQSRQFELHNTDRDIQNMSPSTEKGNKCETVYLTVRRRQPPEKSPLKSSAQGVPRVEDLNDGWERCTVYGGESTSCRAFERKDGGDEQSVNRIRKEEGEGDDYTFSQRRSTLSFERLSPLSGIDERKSTSTTEVDTKEMMTQQKRRISINTSNCRLNPGLMNYSHASPERCRASKLECKTRQQDHQGPDTHWIAAGDAQSAGQRNDGSSLQTSKVNGNERMFLPLVLS